MNNKIQILDFLGNDWRTEAIIASLAKTQVKTELQKAVTNGLAVKEMRNGKLYYRKVRPLPIPPEIKRLLKKSLNILSYELYG